jgi:hypothetical protein
MSDNIHTHKCMQMSCLPQGIQSQYQSMLIKLYVSGISWCTCVSFMFIWETRDMVVVSSTSSGSVVFGTSMCNLTLLVAFSMGILWHKYRGTCPLLYVCTLFTDYIKYPPISFTLKMCCCQIRLTTLLTVKCLSCYRAQNICQ